MKLLTLTPRKAIVYPPGIISLVLLPLFCMIYLKQHKAFVNYRMMDVNVWSSDNDYASMQKYLPKKYQNKLPPDRAYLTFDLNGNDVNDQIKLNQAQNNILWMVKFKDTLNGININFGGKTKYETYVATLDFLYKNEIPNFFLDKDHVAVYYNKPKPIVKTMSGFLL